MKTEVLQTAYSRGSVRDLPRHMLPTGACWKVTDYIPDFGGAPLFKRGPWRYAYTITGGASVQSVAYAPFSSGDQIVSINDSGTLFSGSTSKGTIAATLTNTRPVFFDNLLIIPGGTVYKYDGSAAPSALAGAPANGSYGVAYKERLVLAVTDTLNFSAPGDPTTWDALSTIGTTYTITGLAALNNMIAVFSKGHAERLRGATPPSSTSAGDMVLEPMFDQGCLDARSIVVSDDKMIWANANGVWISDGSALDNLIELGGMRQYWQGLMKVYGTGYSIAGGLFGGYYVLSVVNGTTLVDTLMCKLSTKTWTFLSNLPVRMFAEAYGTAPELYMGLANDLHVAKLSPVFNSLLNAADDNGTSPTPTLETPFYRGAPGSKRWRNLYVGVDFQPNLGTAYMTVEYVTTPDGTAYTTVLNPDGTTFKITPTGAYQRVKVPLNEASDGIGLRFTQVGPSLSTAIFDIEAEVRDREGAR